MRRESEANPGGGGRGSRAHLLGLPSAKKSQGRPQDPRVLVSVPRRCSGWPQEAFGAPVRAVEMATLSSSPSGMISKQG